MNTVNLHIYPSPFKYETRILKETKSITKLGLVSHVIILSTNEKGLSPQEPVDDRIQVRRIKTRLQNIFPDSKAGKALMYIEFYVRAFFFARKQVIHIINCHSLMILPLSAILKAWKRCKLIYDPHELETERLGLSGLSQKVSKLIERILIRYCDEVIVVSKSIGAWYEKTYGLKDVTVVRNIPNFTNLTPDNILKKEFNIPENSLLFIYQGLLHEGRSIELYINAFAKLPSEYHLVVMGYGSLEENVRRSAAQHNNIHFRPAVKPEEIMRYTSSADVGLTLIENCCLSYYYCLPNKFFEYLMAELPVIVSDFPEMADLVRQHNVGWPVEVCEEKLFTLIGSLDQKTILQKKLNIKMMKNEFKWENEETAFRKVYEKLLDL